MSEIKIRLSHKAVRYIDKLVEIEGYGEDRNAVIERFIWDGINRLLEVNTLSTRQP